MYDRLLHNSQDLAGGRVAPPAHGVDADPSGAASGEPLHEHSNVVAFARRVQVRIVLQNPEEIIEAPRFRLAGDNVLDGFWILTRHTPELGTFIPYSRFVSMSSFLPDEEER